jgi:hypothetical protein
VKIAAARRKRNNRELMLPFCLISSLFAQQSRLKMLTPWYYVFCAVGFDYRGALFAGFLFPVKTFLSFVLSAFVLVCGFLLMRLDSKRIAQMKTQQEVGDPDGADSSLN